MVTLIVGFMCLVGGCVLGTIFGDRAKAQVMALEARVQFLEKKL